MYFPLEITAQAELKKERKKLSLINNTEPDWSKDHKLKPIHVNNIRHHYRASLNRHMERQMDFVSLSFS